MKYPASHLTPFLATLLQEPRHPFRCQLLPSRTGQGLSAGASSACALLNSLVALFSTPILCFQRLAHSFAKTPGGWGIPDGSAGYSGWVSLCDTSAFSAPLPYHLQWFGALLCFHNLTI